MASGSPRNESSGRGRRRAARHYHLVDNKVGDPRGYRDDLYPSRRQAEAAARLRVEWLAAVAGLRVEALTGGARYLVTTGGPTDAGRMIEVEGCDDPDCLQVAYWAMC